MTHLVLTVRFLDDRYHGLLDRGGPPEWPPSPFRLFQALVAGLARRHELVVGQNTPGNTNFTGPGRAIGWLQKLAPPIIVAPMSKTGQAITRFVPNNDSDKKLDRQHRLTAKATIPTLFLLDQDQMPDVHYIWDISGQPDLPLELVREAARSLTTLGWGIDMAFADARSASQAEIALIPGVHWHPKLGASRDDGMLRTPTFNEETRECSLCDLRHCHETAMDRIQHGKPLRTVDRPKVFRSVLYTSTEGLIGRPTVIFHLRKGDESFFDYPQARLIHIAGMVRHLAIESMKRHAPDGVPEQWVRSYVAGHCDDQSKDHRQFSFLPLPSIGHPHTDPSVRRVMITAPIGDDAELNHLAMYLNGEVLQPTSRTKMDSPPTLVRERRDNVARFYTDNANAWASVTPVILPGHGDRRAEKTRKLIEKALQQSGIEQSCEFEWGAYSHFPKSLSAYKYDRQKRPTGYIRPDHLLDQTAVHLTLRFRDGIKVPGPLTIGAGRHCGFGLMAGID
jgi:CRISPR-associated protein Csb2